MAVRTARTAVTGAQNAGRTNSYKRAQSMGVKLKQEWLATLDLRTRHSHRQLDGEKVEVGKKFSNGLRYPADPNGSYAEIMNCRCTLIAALDGIEDGAGKRWSKLPEGMTYEQWKELVAVEIDELTPCLRRLSDNKIVDTHFEIIDPRKMDLRNWEFEQSWKSKNKEGYTVKGLFAENDTRVQGLVAYKDAPKDKGVYVALVESAPHNSGYNKTIKNKEYSGVGAHLFAEAVRESFDLGYNGFIGFQAKNKLVKHYSKILGAFQVGSSQQMIVDETAAKKLYERYYGNK